MQTQIVQFHKISLPPPRKVMEIPRELGEGEKEKVLQEKYEAKLEFPEGWGKVKVLKESMELNCNF